MHVTTEDINAAHDRFAERENSIEDALRALGIETPEAVAEAIHGLLGGGIEGALLAPNVVIGVVIGLALPEVVAQREAREKFTDAALMS